MSYKSCHSDNSKDRHELKKSSQRVVTNSKGHSMNAPCHTSRVTITNDPEIHPYIYIRVGVFRMTYTSCHNHKRPVSCVQHSCVYPLQHPFIYPLQHSFVSHVRTATRICIPTATHIRVSHTHCKIHSNARQLLQWVCATRMGDRWVHECVLQWVCECVLQWVCECVLQWVCATRMGVAVGRRMCDAVGT